MHAQCFTKKIKRENVPTTMIVWGLYFKIFFFFFKTALNILKCLKGVMHMGKINDVSQRNGTFRVGNAYYSGTLMHIILAQTITSVSLQQLRQLKVYHASKT